MTDHRAAVRANAQYLRQVRPIDPEEISSYIDGEPHPAVVRQLLREQATDLDLLERADGTFVPVADEPVPPQSLDRNPITAFPARYATRLEDELVERYGVNWHEGPTGDVLRSTLRRLKAQYLERQDVTYDEDVAAAYAIYHLPGYYAAMQYVLEDLTARGLLGRSLRVLDIGAGVGGPALGLCDYLPDGALLEYHAVEPGDGAAYLEALLEETGRNVHPTVHRRPVESFEPPSGEDGTVGGFDLVCLCNVLSELEDPETVLRQALEWTAPDGTLLAMAPADKNASIELRRLERAVEDTTVTPAGLTGGTESGENDSGGEENTDTRTVTVYGPTVRLWQGERPTDRGWSFDVRPDLDVPAFQANLDEVGDGDTAGEFVNVDVQFSYALFRLDGTRHIDHTLEGTGQAKMAEMDRHVTDRVDLTAAKLSHSLSETGARRGHGPAPNPVFKISDGSEAVDHYAVLTAETDLNRPLVDAAYGALLSFENVLVLWNDDEGAYNLVVDDETIVDRLA